MRNRRRWIIALAVILLLLAGWSVRSSRRDPRLVGRWQPGSGATHWLLNADGSYCLVTADAQVVKTTQEWYVYRGRLYLTPAGGYWTGISKDLRNYRLQGKTPPPWPTFEIVSISSDNFVLNDPRATATNVDGRVTFTRVPDDPAPHPATPRPAAD